MTTTRWTTIQDAEQAVNDGRFEGSSEAFRAAIIEIAWEGDVSVSHALAIHSANGGDCEGFENEPDWYLRDEAAGSLA